MILRLPAIVLTISLLGACATIPVEDRVKLREEINQGAENTLMALINDNPKMQEAIDTSIGYFTGHITGAKIPAVGGGKGLGVLYDKDSNTRTYLNIKRFDLGAGLGAAKYRPLILFYDRETMEQVKTGVVKLSVGIETGAGETAATTVSEIGKGAKMYLLGETGVALAASARLVRLTVNDDLTDSGVSPINFPNTGFTSSNRQGDDAPRIWEHKLPFSAQKIIDKGFDLPLPYGIGFSYVRVEQDQVLEDLEVGINGLPKKPFEFVAFENSYTNNDTGQLKLDVWVLPFMNVFALLGKVDGQAPLDVILDGNGMLAHINKDCSGVQPDDSLCSTLEDRTFTLPITAGFHGNTYSIGAVVAGGWNNWFASIPFSFTYADMDGKDSEGISITITPRAGRVFNLGNKGNLALFAGGNYLKSEYTVTGTVYGPRGISIDYTVNQSNKDRWNVLVGGNWDINKHWSVTMEYDGFIGSRELFLLSFTHRF